MREPWMSLKWRIYRFFRWKIYWPVVSFLAEIKYFIQRGRRGYSDRDVWSFDDYLAEVISAGARELAKTTYGHPAGLSSLEEWQVMLNQIADAFETSSKDTELWFDDYKSMGPDNANEMTEKRWDKIEEGMLLFVKHFGGLWN